MDEWSSPHGLAMRCPMIESLSLLPKFWFRFRPICLCLCKGELPVNYSPSQNCCHTFVSPCPLNVGVQGFGD